MSSNFEQFKKLPKIEKNHILGTFLLQNSCGIYSSKIS